MAIDPTQALADDFQHRLMVANREYAKLEAQHESLKAAEKEYRAEIAAYKQKYRAAFAESRILAKELQRRSILVCKSFMEQLREKVEWAEYLEEAEEQSLVIVDDQKLEDRVESIVNIMLGLELRIKTPSPSPEPIGIKLRQEDREELAKLYQLDEYQFETKEELMVLLAQLKEKDEEK